MTKNNFKTILFVSLIVAMILPFSAMNLADAAPDENTNDKDKKWKDHEKLPKDKTHKDMIDDGYRIYPGGHYIHPSNILEKVKRGDTLKDIERKNHDPSIYVKGLDGEWIVDIEKAIEKTMKERLEDVDETSMQNYPATGYNNVAMKIEADSMSYFRAYWEVPTSPTYYDGNGTIFTFNAMQPHMPGTLDNAIFQPVLQYGNNGPCSNIDDRWVAYAYWYVSKTINERGDCIPVNPGDLVRGIISESGGTWTISMYHYQSGVYDSVIASYGGFADTSLVAVETYNLAEDCPSISGDEEFKYMIITGDSVSWEDANSSVYANGGQWCGMNVNIVADNKVQLNNDN